MALHRAAKLSRRGWLCVLAEHERECVGVKDVILFLFCVLLFVPRVFGQVERTDTLEQRQPLELVFADSIVPQDYHEMMLTTGASYGHRRPLHDGRMTQKVEWGISDKLQVSTFLNPPH